MAGNATEEILESVLNGYQLRVEIVSDARYCGSWYENEAASNRGQFHLIGEGECLVSGPAIETPIQLHGGDLVIFPHGARHTLSAVTEGPASGPSCEFTTMLCGELDFAMGSHNPVLLALPDCFVVRAQDGGESFRKLASVLIATAGLRQTGRQVVMNKLAETLFAIAVCEFANTTDNRRGLFAALADPRMTRVLEAIHRRAGEDWDLQALAGVAGMSRSAFASHFAEVMGIPPMQYLASWRITQAKQLLKDRRLSVAAIAEQLGYKSETAFRKLFKRLEGIGPGRVRAAARNDTSVPEK